MRRITVVARSGEARSLDAAGDGSLMEALRGGGFDDILALCGGCCACATCHVHLDRTSFAALPPMSEDENDLLDAASERDATSRLSCQVAVADLPPGATVRIAAED